MIVMIPRNELADVLLKGTASAGHPDFTTFPRVEYWFIRFDEPGYIVVVTEGYVQLIGKGSFEQFNREAVGLLEALKI